MVGGVEWELEICYPPVACMAAGRCGSTVQFTSTSIGCTFHCARLAPNPLALPCAPLQELGVQILSDLQRQRETILHSRDTLAGVDVNISKSRQILSVMSRRVIQNKV